MWDGGAVTDLGTELLCEMLHTFGLASVDSLFGLDTENKNVKLMEICHDEELE